MLVAAPVLLLVVAQSVPSPAPPSPPPSPGASCQTGAHRSFDFWIGEWDVTNQQPPAGKTPPAAKSRISRILHGCAILDEYETPGGYAGKSLNFHDGKAWRQVWVDTGAQPLFIEGGLAGPSMVMSDAGRANRITWTPLPGGRVRQHWETSKDGGKTFTTAFDGLYTPRAQP